MLDIYMMGVYSIYQIFYRRPPVKAAEVIQMVTGKEEPQSPPIPPPSSSHKDTNAHAPPFDQGKTDYGGGKLEGSRSPIGPSSKGQTIYGRDIPQTPPTPQGAPSRGQTTYGQIQTVRQYMVELTGVHHFLHNPLTQVAQLWMIMCRFNVHRR
ncbi:hypothetical protein LXL04_031998 [Taraxacum kok-saghyz]